VNDGVLENLLDGAHQSPGPKRRKNHRAQLAKRNQEIERDDPRSEDANDEDFDDVDDESFALPLLDAEESMHPCPDPPLLNDGAARKGRLGGTRRRARTCFGKLLSIVELDIETRKVYKLAIPYFLQALISGVADNGTLIVVGQLIGTRELAAFAIVDLFVGLTSQTIGGYMESLTPLLSFSRGTDNEKLTGQYVQLAMILTVASTIPFIFLWSFVTDDLMKLLGFDETTAEIGQSFAVPFMFAKMIHLLTRCLHTVMDVNDLEVQSTIVAVTGDVGELVAVLIFALFWSPTLQDIGFVFVVAETLALLATVALIGFKGWFRPFYAGFFRTLSLKVRC
jgi:O-antigen/teichoic acid export membrane protein